MIPKTEQPGVEIVLTPATAATGLGLTFSVGSYSKVCRIITDTDLDPGADDAFELHSVLAFTKSTGVVTKSYPVKEVDPVSGTSFGLLLGGNMTQAEIVVRGNYAWKKTVITTPEVGIEAFDGYERR